MSFSFFSIVASLRFFPSILPEGLSSTLAGRVLMAIATNILQCLVPISQFNKGQASKIFDRLRSEKELIVLKNNQPSAIILSPEEYTRLTEIEEDYFLLLEANKRLEENGSKPTVPLSSVLDELGITEKELEETEDVAIE